MKITSNKITALWNSHRAVTFMLVSILRTLKGSLV